MSGLTKEQKAQLFAEKQCAFMQQIAAGLTKEKFLRNALNNPEVYQSLMSWYYGLPTGDKK